MVQGTHVSRVRAMDASAFSFDAAPAADASQLQSSAPVSYIMHSVGTHASEASPLESLVTASGAYESFPVAPKLPAVGWMQPPGVASAPPGMTTPPNSIFPAGLSHKGPDGRSPPGPPAKDLSSSLAGQGGQASSGQPSLINISTSDQSWKVVSPSQSVPALPIADAPSPPKFGVLARDSTPRVPVHELVKR